MLNNFLTGRIYRGDLKIFCSPGLNCYSCPAAAVSCPVGTAQFFLTGLRHDLSLYIAGFLTLTGVLFGRFVCGYVCPMGLLQDLLYGIRSPKLRPRFRFLRYLKYLILAALIIFLPLFAAAGAPGSDEPWFCKYVCPSGTIFGALPLLAANGALRRLVGPLFIYKAASALVILSVSVFIFRFFCRVLCPLGAVYSLFNRISVLRMRCDKELCVSCGRCGAACPIGIEPAAEPNSPECVRCGKCSDVCGGKALKLNSISRRCSPG